jgi:uncharacterized protein YecT (DUF1311 family)
MTLESEAQRHRAVLRGLSLLRSRRPLTVMTMTLCVFGTLWTSHPAHGQTWYYCDDPAGYYPYVRTCLKPWRPVPSQPANPATPQSTEPASHEDALAPPVDLRPGGITPAPDAAPSPSFNCSSARSVDELLICGDPDLRRADGVVGEEFRRLRDRATLPLRDKIIRDQRAWIVRRNDACGLTPNVIVTAANRGQLVSCLARQFKARTDELSGNGAGASPSEHSADVAGEAAAQRAPEAPSPSTISSASDEAKTNAGAKPAKTRDVYDTPPHDTAGNEQLDAFALVLVVVAIIITGIITLIWYSRKSEREKLIARREHLIAKYGDPGIADKIMQHLIWQGMSEEQLIDSWGNPADKAQRVYKTRVTETFKYNRTGRNRFGNRVVVENGVVVGWDQK